MKFTVEQVARVLGMANPSQALITGWSVDTRTLSPGDAFFAIHGPSHDGNAYIEEALRKGAVLAVPDALPALQKLAAWARDQWNGDVIGVTGSAGKTSTKDVIAALLSVELRAGKTEGNFNNHVGLPLSILRLPEEAQVAVLELGMNHAGEIRDLALIAKPKIGVVTNVGHAHIEFFDSIEGIAAAKRELIESLPPDGVAVLNADDPLVVRFAEVHPGRTITFGFSDAADIRAADFRFLTEKAALAGPHGVRNILAGVAVAGVYGIHPEELREAVLGLQPGKMRGEITWYHGIELLNDCYNSNPDAAKLMLQTLRDTPATRRVAVLGEMLELGRWSESLHRDVGRYVAESGIDVLVGIRGAARAMVDAAIHAGLPATAAYFFEDPLDAGACLRDFAREGDAILFKGSRGTHVERAIEAFMAGHAEGAPVAQAYS